MNYLAQILASALFFSAVVHFTAAQDSGSSMAEAQCFMKMNQCIAPYTQATGQGAVDVVALASLCSEFPEVQKCLSKLKGGENCMLATATIQATMSDVMVNSGICDQKEDLQKYSDCFSKQEILSGSGCMPKQAGAQLDCDSLVEQTECFTRKAKELCGQRQSELMNMVAKAMARSIANSQKKTCPRLARSGVGRSVPLPVVMLGLLSLVIPAVALN